MRKYIGLFVIAVFCFGCKERFGSPTPESELTEKEIRDFVNDYDNMWAKRDTASMKEAMADNYIYFTSVGSITDRKQILGWFVPADKYKVDTATRTEIDVTIHGNTAIVSSRWIGSGSFDGEKFRDDQRCSLTIQKEEGKLKLISEHCTQIVDQH
ncbi:MAG TPA: nuclear transport factor 2 family protein [Chitinophagaceae bacterium]|nr:nuclear transport factor 2 family protein [Chitinophagaceae bacterium]